MVWNRHCPSGAPGGAGGGFKPEGQNERPNFAATLGVYGTAHLVVDAVCAAAVMQIPAVRAEQADNLVAWLVLYHALAFGLQPLLGLAADAAQRHRAAAIGGCLVSSAALLVPSLPMLAVVIAGIGNAAFHVGAGVLCLRTTPHRATAPGLFVAPGSIGLLLGVILGKMGPTASLSLLPVALAVCFLMTCLPRRVRARTHAIPQESAPPACEHAPYGPIGPGELFLGLILLSIAVRALLSFLVGFAWETQPGLLILLTLAAVAGKAAGGILADRWGWLRVGVGALVAALPFLALGATHPVVAITGILLLNLTMPVTLAAVVEALPGYPGFAFGLTCLALLLGTAPSLLGVSIGGPIVVSTVILVSAAALYRGLRMLPVNRSSREAVGV
jgi:MFS transporter, FSR family, fosmidomycin resistance protein